MLVRVCIALGSNLGDRLAHLHFAFDQLAFLRDSSLVRRSEIIETPPLGPPGQQAYLNAAAIVETRLSARALLNEMLSIERRAGRDRSTTQRWGPRTLDLDLLLFGETVIVEPGLTVPHPCLHERRFVLEPLAQIAPEAMHPILGRSVAQLLDDLNRAE